MTQTLTSVACRRWFLRERTECGKPTTRQTARNGTPICDACAKDMRIPDHAFVAAIPSESSDE